MWDAPEGLSGGAGVSRASTHAGAGPTGGSGNDDNTDVKSLLPLFDKGIVPLVFDGPEFVGLITRMDLLGHLRRQL